MVRQWQELFYGKRYSATILTQHNRPENEHIPNEAPRYLPDFIKVAEAYGLKAARVTSLDAAEKVFAEAFSDNNTWLIECIVAEDEMVLPMVPPGAPLSDMIYATEN
jgi:acetolactate synthase-1/2/3 large subunit